MPPPPRGRRPLALCCPRPLQAGCGRAGAAPHQPLPARDWRSAPVDPGARGVPERVRTCPRVWPGPGLCRLHPHSSSSRSSSCLLSPVKASRRRPVVTRNPGPAPATWQSDRPHPTAGAEPCAGRGGKGQPASGEGAPHIPPRAPHPPGSSSRGAFLLDPPRSAEGNGFKSRQRHTAPPGGSGLPHGALRSARGHPAADQAADQDAAAVGRRLQSGDDSGRRQGLGMVAGTAAHGTNRLRAAENRH